MEQLLENRVLRYWTARAPSFGSTRSGELRGALGARWGAALERLLPGPGLRVLDAGTGTGFFSILLARRGFRMTGIDLTPAMIGEAKRQAEAEALGIRFLVMDAQTLSFPDGSFDAVVSRNLTWTLPEPERAYREWHRVLKKGGVLLNFDANYAEALRKSGPGGPAAYGHAGVTPALSRENAEITLSMEASRARRPDWDLAVLREAGFRGCRCDLRAGEAILRECSDPAAPMFLVSAVK